MKNIKIMMKKIVISIVVFMTILSSCSTSFAATSEQVANAAAGFAVYILPLRNSDGTFKVGKSGFTTSGQGKGGKLQYSIPNRTQNPFMSLDESKNSIYLNKEVWYFDCSSFVTACCFNPK